MQVWKQVVHAMKFFLKLWRILLGLIYSSICFGEAIYTVLFIDYKDSQGWATLACGGYWIWNENAELGFTVKYMIHTD